MAIKTVIGARDVVVDENFEEYVSKKSNKLERYINGIQEVRIDLQHNKSARDANDRYKAKITVRGKGYLLRSEERKVDIRAAFDSALSKMQSRISRYKGKRFSKKGDGSSLADIAIEEMEPVYEAENELPEIVRRKKIFLEPMNENEAIEEMKILDHEDFFLFFNVETNSIGVLYKRHDGNFGLIEGEQI